MIISTKKSAELIPLCEKVWDRLKVKLSLSNSNLTVENVSDLWFRTWASIAYEDSNPNVIRDEKGQRLLEYNPDFELYPCNADDESMKSFYKRIYKSLTA